MVKSRYWQAVRGICILAVIMIHCPAGDRGVDQTIWLALRQFINFPVAIFIFMAGYFVKPDKVNGIYLKNRVRRLLMPFLLWSTFYTVKNALFNNVRSWDKVLFNFVTGQSAAPLYYILVMIQFTLLTPLFVKMKNRKWLYVITPLYLCGLYIWNFNFGMAPSLYGTFFPAWLFFYILGMDTRTGKLNNVVMRAMPYWVAVTFVIALMEAFVLRKLGCSISFASSQIKFSTFAYTGTIILLLLKNQKKEEKGIIGDVIGKVGDCSYGIFFLHMMVMYIVAKILRILDSELVWVVEWLMDFIFTAVVSYILVSYARKRIRSRNILKAIGLD